MKSKIIIVSNRLPKYFVKTENGIKALESVGGLATGLKSFYRDRNCFWVGWPGIKSDEITKSEKSGIKEILHKENCLPVFISDEEFEGYYNGFANRIMWPLCHYFGEHAYYNEDSWDKYKKVNEKFARVVNGLAQPDDTVWIHDYHLMLLPDMLREMQEDLSIGFFLHIPFPSSEIFRLLPWRSDIIKGIMGADLIGFHTYDYVRHFLETIRRVSGFEHTYGQIQTGKRLIRVDAFPMGIDYKRFSGSSSETEVIQEIKNFDKMSDDHKIILTIDRLDYTKGIPERLESFDHFLKKYPEYHGKVSLVMVSAPSRTGVLTYAELKKKVDELVGRINGKYGNIDWVPVKYFYRSMPYKKISALYHLADILMVTPIRDGMNLVAKEFIAAKRDMDGMVIISETAGASQELVEAIQVNVNNHSEVAYAIKEALEMPSSEKKRRMLQMRNRIERYDIRRWAEDILDELKLLRRKQNEFLNKQVTDKVKNEMMLGYSRSIKRIFFLDYDGSLVEFQNKPEGAVPDDNLYLLLNSLAEDRNNTVYLISGRKKNNLDEWFSQSNFDSSENLGIIAEHGVWIKNPGESWDTVFPLDDDWKKEIYPIFEKFSDRTPGSFIEEKDYSLVWHYRNVNPTLAHVRINEIKDVLINLTENLSLGIIMGNKIIEVKNLNINKGMAVKLVCDRLSPDFVLAIGDDRTDEDMFSVLSESAYTIKVGLKPTKAKYYVNNVDEVRNLLKKFTEKR
jgi:trehalose 6-phosphate synthase/phosphatase